MKIETLRDFLNDPENRKKVEGGHKELAAWARETRALLRRIADDLKDNQLNVPDTGTPGRSVTAATTMVYTLIDVSFNCIQCAVDAAGKLIEVASKESPLVSLLEALVKAEEEMQEPTPDDDGVEAKQQ